MRFILWLIAAAYPVAAMSGADAVFQSGPKQVALLELYTSEGCSSCPPAEKWLGELKTAAGLWGEFVPVAFHVNYWDHLGWRDVLASKTFTAREHAYAEAWGAPSVYTPCFVRNGEEWRDRDLKALKGTGGGADSGLLKVTWDPAKSVAQVSFVPPKNAKRSAALDVNIALLGGAIVSQVRKGENAGRELRHEFVALRFESTALKSDANGTWSGAIALPAETHVTATRHALAAWITSSGRLTPLQATGGWLE